MPVQPPQNYTYSAKAHINSLSQGVNQSMTRAAIVLDREAKDLTPLAVFSLPALGLVTFYGRNQAFTLSPADKGFKRALKCVGQKTTDIVSNTLDKGFKFSGNALKRAGYWTKYNAKETYSELRGMCDGNLTRLCRALRDDARDVMKAIFRR